MFSFDNIYFFKNIDENHVNLNNYIEINYFGNLYVYKKKLSEDKYYTIIKFTDVNDLDSIYNESEFTQSLTSSLYKLLKEVIEYENNIYSNFERYLALNIIKYLQKNHNLNILKINIDDLFITLFEKIFYNTKIKDSIVITDMEVLYENYIYGTYSSDVD